LKKKGSRGPVRGRDITWAVREDGAECLRHAMENVAAVVGRSDNISYSSKALLFAFACEKKGSHQ
jgi:hypothetical protein